MTDVSVPTSTGFATVKDNLGLVRNSGIEAYLSYGVLQQNRTFLTVFGSLVTTKNKIIRLSESMRDTAEGECIMNGCIFEFDNKTGKALSVEPVIIEG